MTAKNAASEGFFKKYGLLIAILVMGAIMLMPSPEGLPVAGQRMLAVLVFAVIVWMSEAISYSASAVVILALMAFFLGISPDVANPLKAIGSGRGLGMALVGFSNSAVAMVAAALVLAAAMQHCGLDRRIALLIMSRVGGKTSNVIIGLFVVGYILALIVPSTTARSACLVPIAMGIVSVLGVDRRSNIAGLILITTAMSASVGNIAVKTSAAQNLVGVGFIEKQIAGASVTWMDWFICGAPFSLAMCIAAYFVMLKVLPPEVKEIPGGQQMIKKALDDLGPMTGAEKRMLIITSCMLVLWVTEKTFHPIGSAAVTVIGAAFILLPKIGVLNWAQTERNVSWGTMLLVGVGIGLGSVILSTKGAAWLANYMTDTFGIAGMSAFMALMVMAVFSTVLHLGFASATAITSAIMPIMIVVIQNLEVPGVNVLGLALVLLLTVSFGFILPVNSPQNMIAFGTDTFTAANFIKIGIPYTIVVLVLYAIFALTYWSWMGYV